MSDSRSISGTVKTSSDSGSPERVAFDLMVKIATHQKIDGANWRSGLLDLYAECLEATRGFRQYK